MLDHLNLVIHYIRLTNDSLKLVVYNRNILLLIFGIKSHHSYFTLTLTTFNQFNVLFDVT